MSYLTPYSEAGRWGLKGYQDLLRNPSVIKDTPGYQFRLDQGLESLERSAAARGMLMSGATGEKLQEYGQNYATGQLQYSLGNMERLMQYGATADQSIADIERWAGGGLANIGVGQAGFEERYGGALSDLDMQRANLESNLGINRANIQTGTAAQASNISGQYATNIAQGMGNVGQIQGQNAMNQGYISASGQIAQSNAQTTMLNNLASLGMQAYMGYSMNQPQAPAQTTPQPTSTGFYPPGIVA